ncbi:MAG TPA: DMT family transporter [Egibacteraceae bacterium]|nr:DMT family transporter [Egibacteraceae bacterium]
MTPHDPRAAAGLTAVVSAVVVSSWGFIIVKLIDLPAAVISFWRLVAGATVLSAVALALRTPWPRLRGAVLVAGLAFGVHQLLFVVATKATSVAIVTLVGALQPLLVSLASRRVVGERVPLPLVGFSALALAGVGIVVHANLGDPSRSLAGDLLAVANVLMFTAYFLFAKRARQEGAATLTFTASVFAVALIVVAPVMVLGGAALPSGGQAGMILLLAMAPGNGHLLINWAHRRVSAALSSLALAAIPLLSSVWGRLVLGEPYGWRHAAGMLLTIVAIEGGRRVERARAVGEAAAVRAPRADGADEKGLGG